ncbi:class II fructose-bisphosphatase [Candidatus Woesearchaeota archaeon]|nr:class II fructose-bisphosphatase [Candidatus Woesearchaeota archaeon]
MERNLALEFVRVTEAAALAAARWMGKGDKNKADGAAVEAMRERFNWLDFDGEVVIGEGEKDEAPQLYTCEFLGSKKGPKMDIAIDPLECTENLALGKPNAISVLAAAPRGCLLKVPGTYMDQISVGHAAKGAIDITRSIKENIEEVAFALDKKVEDVTVIVLDRPRHKELIQQIRDAGARIRLIEHGTISGGLAPAISNSGIDMMAGIGGAPEAVITAAALRCLGGDLQAVLKPHNDKAKAQAAAMGFHDLAKVFKVEEIAKGDSNLFAATGISDGPLLKGVSFSSFGATTHSIVMRQHSGTIRFIEANHHFNKERRGL